MKKLFIFLIACLFAVGSQAQSLRVKNQLSMWLNTKVGFDKYSKDHPNNPNYFCHIVSTDIEQEKYKDLEEGMDYCYNKITGQPVTEKYGFSLTQKVRGGTAGACYAYPDSQVQDARDLIVVENNFIAIAYEWAAEHNATVTAIVYQSLLPLTDPNYSPERYLVITILINPVASSKAQAVPVTTKNFNVLLYDPIKDSIKLALEDSTGKDVTHIYEFVYNYTKKENILRRDLDSSLKEIKANEVIPAGSDHPLRLHNRAGKEIEWSYYTHNATDRISGTLEGMFLDYFVAAKLLKDPRALADFKAWFESVVIEWGKENSITWVIDRAKPREHWLRFHAEISVAQNN